MKDIIIAIGSKENIQEDVNVIAGQLASNPEIVIASGKDARNVVIEKASNLFINDSLVLVIIDPGKDLIEALKGPLDVLKEKISVVIFSTNPSDKVSDYISGKLVVLEQDKEKRLKGKVRDVLKEYGKKMTDKAFNLLTERIKDESILPNRLKDIKGFNQFSEDFSDTP